MFEMSEKIKLLHSSPFGLLDDRLLSHLGKGGEKKHV